MLTLTILIVWPASCKKKETPGEADFYYIKYEVNSSSIRTGGKLDVVVGDVENKKTYTINTKARWEINVGPVSKNFLASLKVDKSGTPDSDLRLQAQISVSKNNEPFVLKKADNSDVRRNSVSIDFLVGN
jgi:hypothetical protein